MLEKALRIFLQPVLVTQQTADRRGILAAYLLEAFNGFHDTQADCTVLYFKLALHTKRGCL
jgi:hypothetical protein